MIAEISVDSENRTIQRILIGEIDTNQALSLVREISNSAKMHDDYNILVDMRDTTFHPEMIDLLEIAAECSKLLIGFSCKIAFLIPDTEQRKLVAKIFRTCMEAEGFEFKQFFEYDSAMEWLSD
ncbi:MAG: hypothetical protein PVF59_04400 [Desulfobacterales bacterium]|jgi:hypothetical protein